MTFVPTEPASWRWPSRGSAKLRERRAEPRLPVIVAIRWQPGRRAQAALGSVHLLTSEFRPLGRATIRQEGVRVLVKGRVHQNVTSPNNGRGARMMPSEKGKAAEVSVRHRATPPLKMLRCLSRDRMNQTAPDHQPFARSLLRTLPVA